MNPTENTQKTILVVDDDPYIVDLMSRQLKAKGFRVLPTTDPETAFSLAEKEKPDLIISDIWMPEPIGFFNQDRLANLGLAGVPVIYITASKKKDLQQIAREEGAAAFFEKPYDAEQLLAAIGQALKEQSLVA